MGKIKEIMETKQQYQKICESKNSTERLSEICMMMQNGINPVLVKNIDTTKENTQLLINKTFTYILTHENIPLQINTNYNNELHKWKQINKIIDKNKKLFEKHNDTINKLINNWLKNNTHY